jgi:hypothetical protein
MTDSDSDFDFDLILVGCVANITKKRRAKRKLWSKQWLLRRNEFGVGSTLLRELRIESAADYQKYLRVSPDLFEDLLSMIGMKISKQDTSMRASIPAFLRLQVTLRYLATG